MKLEVRSFLNAASTKPLVSVIMPLYNKERFVVEAIETCLNQSYEDIEVLVIDDASSDQSAQLVAAIQDSRVELIRHDRNRGASAARNTGLRNASGMLVQYLDADDLLHQRKIESQVDQTVRCGLSVTPWKDQRDRLEPRTTVQQGLETVSSPCELLTRIFLGQATVPVHAWLTRKDLLDCAGEWDEGLSAMDDGEYFVRVMCAGSELAHINNSYCIYRRVLDGNLSGRRDSAAISSILSAAKKSVTSAVNRYCTEEMHRASATFLMAVAFNVFPRGGSERVEIERLAKVLWKGRVTWPTSDLVTRLKPLTGWRIAKLVELGWRKIGRTLRDLRDIRRGQRPA